MVENATNAFRVSGEYTDASSLNYSESEDYLGTKSGWPLAFQYFVSVLGYVLNT